MLTVHNISKSYRRNDKTFFRSARASPALKNVSLALQARSRTALIGCSGTGKSTLARCLAGFEAPESGEVILHGRNLYRLAPAEFRTARRTVQLVFQDAAMAFNPRFTLHQIVSEPLTIAGVPPAERQDRSLLALDQVAISSSWTGRRAHELSGGQRQRLAIARALAAHPELLILDESLSGLDLVTQSQLIDLLRLIQETRKFACLFISHDLRLVANIADRVLVMHAGEIVEEGSPRELFAQPRHPSTIQLVQAVPKPLSSLPAEEL